MSITPVELRHVKLRRRAFGYERKSVDRLIAEVVASFETTWRERADLGDEVERLEAEVAHFRELDVLLRNSLVAAERTADDLKTQARREADLLLEEARTRARQLVGAAEDERDRVKAEVRRLRTLETEVRANYRSFLVGALERVEDEADEPVARVAGREAPEAAAR